jgi:hypothetical protein
VSDSAGAPMVGSEVVASRLGIYGRPVRPAWKESSCPGNFDSSRLAWQDSSHSGNYVPWLALREPEAGFEQMMVCRQR